MKLIAKMHFENVRESQFSTIQKKNLCDSILVHNYMHFDFYKVKETHELFILSLCILNKKLVKSRNIPLRSIYIYIYIYWREIATHPSFNELINCTAWKMFPTWSSLIFQLLMQPLWTGKTSFHTNKNSLMLFFNLCFFKWW